MSDAVDLRVRGPMEVAIERYTGRAIFHFVAAALLVGASVPLFLVGQQKNGQESACLAAGGKFNDCYQNYGLFYGMGAVVGALGVASAALGVWNLFRYSLVVDEERRAPRGQKARLAPWLAPSPTGATAGMHLIF